MSDKNLKSAFEVEPRLLKEIAESVFVYSVVIAKSVKTLNDVIGHFVDKELEKTEDKEEPKGDPLLYTK